MNAFLQVYETCKTVVYYLSYCFIQRPQRKEDAIASKYKTLEKNRRWEKRPGVYWKGFIFVINALNEFYPACDFSQYNEHAAD